MVNFDNLKLTQQLIEEMKIVVIWGILSYIFLKISLSWKNYFKSLSKTLTSFSVFFLIFFFVLCSVSSNSESIVDSIQPSIDIMMLDIMDDYIENQYPIVDQDIRISMSNDSEVMKFYNHNITDKQANYLADSFSIKDKSLEEKRIFTKILITSIYDEIQKNKELENVPIPISQIKSTAQAQIQDLDKLNNVDITMLGDFFEINEEANIVILLSKNETIEEMNPSKLELDQVNLIWKKLELNENVSFTTKNKIISMFFTQVANELNKKNEGNDIAIPIDTIKHILPKEIKEMMNYDLFSTNDTVKMNALNNLRNTCNQSISTTAIVTSTSQQDITQGLCKGLLMTKYDNLMASMQDPNVSSQINAPVNISKLVEPISSIDKIENKLEDIGYFSFWFIFIAVVLFLAGFGSYYLHSKIKSEEISFLKINYYVFKNNFVYYSINYFLIVLLVVFFSQDNIMNFFNSKTNTGSSAVNIDFSKLEIFGVLEQINTSIFTYSTVYFVLSLVVFLALLYLKLNNDKQKKLENNVDKAEDEVENENKNEVESNSEDKTEQEKNNKDIENSIDNETHNVNIEEQKISSNF